jgi:hypothetical protein
MTVLAHCWLFGQVGSLSRVSASQRAGSSPLSLAVAKMLWMVAARRPAGSGGVYWVAAYEVLKSRGLDVILANAREARAVPGRKSDVNDAQWLQRLHACGLLRASFRPGRDIAELRAYLRVRERHTDYAAAHIQHMQKALTFMNLQLHHVIATIIGVTGIRIIRAIADGERDPDKLATMRDVRCKESTTTIRAALVGNYQPEHVFALKQSFTLYNFYQKCIDEWMLKSSEPSPG